MLSAPWPVLLAVATVTLAACGLNPDAPVGPGDPTPRADPSSEPSLVVVDGQAGGPAISVADLLARGDDTAVLVSGALFVDADGTVRLCDAIAESFPPQCAGARVRVEGLDLATVPGLQEASGVRWAEEANIFGRIGR